MRHNRKSMAVSAMVFLLFTAGFFLLTACGSSAYEATAESGISGSDADSEFADTSKSSRNTSEESTPAVPEKSSVFVYICGAVMRPGVYELPSEGRVVDAIRAAGGLAADADATQVNQAEKLTDGEQITVLTKEEAANLPAGQNTQNAGPDTRNGAAAGQADTAPKVNINTATREELMTLKGIGESRADDIIAYRESNGAFGRVEDIMKVSGIKNSLFNKIKDRITV